MRNFLITALTLLAIACLITVPAHAAEETAQGVETVTEVQQEVTEETPTETIFEGTDAEAVTEAITEQEEITTAIDADDALEAEDARQWLIDAIKNAKPEQVEFIKGYIEDALVAMEGLQYTEWEWIYKITSDNAEWVACIIVGLGFIFSGVVMIVKYRREKVLINNSVDAVGVSERKMGEMVRRVGDCEQRFEDLAQENVAVIKRLDERDKQLAEALETIRQLEEKNCAATKHDIDAMLVLADVLDELIQLSNIPQVKKDAI
ncbi:MAG: hypothetical protein IIX86_07740 [Clostridia bacterium]|nr:hypothetical protein [Clostridia bacterium]